MLQIVNPSFSRPFAGRISPALARLAGATLALGWAALAPAQGTNEGAGATESGGELAEQRSYSVDRYASLWEKSLFFSAAPVAVADAAFARDYSLAGVFEMNGVTTAALVNKRDQAVVNVSDSGDAQGSGGMRLIAVESAGDPSQARVQVEKAGQRAWIAVAPSAALAGAGTNASPASTLPINRSAATAPPAASGLPISLENFPKPVAPQIAPNSVAAPGEPEFSSEGDQPPPLPPSPLDAAMATGEEEIVVPIPDGE